MIGAAAPGKLFLAGEYAVVEPGEPALLVAVDRELRVTAEEAVGDGQIRSAGYRRGPIRLVPRPDGGVTPVGRRLDYVSSAVSLAGRLCAERGGRPAPVRLGITSDLIDSRGRKFGLGSSAAVTVATVAALDRLFGLGLDREGRFRLALLATVQVAPRASGGDIAASTFGGWLEYASPDRARLAHDLTADGVAATMSSPGWAGCRIEPLPEPAGTRLLVGWTGRPAATTRLVARSRGGWREAYPGFPADSRAAVAALRAGLAQGPAAAQAALGRARGVLAAFGEASGTLIETPRLRDLCDIAERHGAAAKPSGAGGGDCGIALVDAAVDFTDILHEWKNRGIAWLDLGVAPRGGGVRDE